MTIDPLSPHPSWMRRKWSVFFSYLISRLNDQQTKFLLMPFIHITPRLYVGPQLSKRGWRSLNKRGVNSIVNLRVESNDLERGITPEHYLWLPTIDHTPPTVEQLQKAAAFITQRIAEGDSVYVHCAAGVGRAPLTAAAYLVSQGYQPDEALDLLRSRRPFISQSASQRERLVQFAAKIDPAPIERPPIDTVDKVEPMDTL